MRSPLLQTDLCPACHGLGVVVRPPAGGGWFPAGSTLKGAVLPCRVCATDQRRAWLAEHSGLEPAERRSGANAFRVITSKAHPEWTAQRRKAKTLIEEAVTAQQGWYTFWGDFGSGKSFALQCIVNELRDAHLTEGYYSSFAAIIDHLRSMFATGQDVSDYWERILSVPVLALDEVNRFDDQRGWIIDRLFVLAETRYRARETHLTLCATNANPNVVLPPEDSIGYLFSRMREGKLCELRGDVRSVMR